MFLIAIGSETQKATERKHLILSKVPRSRAYRILKNLNDSRSLRILGRDHANSILSGVSNCNTRKNSKANLMGKSFFWFVCLYSSQHTAHSTHHFIASNILYHSLQFRNRIHFALYFFFNFSFVFIWNGPTHAGIRSCCISINYDELNTPMVIGDEKFQTKSTHLIKNSVEFMLGISLVVIFVFVFVGCTI